MSIIQQKPQVSVQITITLDEIEARALDAVFGYSIDAFIKVFYEHMGKAYLEPHEKGLRTLHDSLRREVPPILLRAQKARDAFNFDAKAKE